MPKISLIDLGKLAKPVEIFVEKVCDAIGGEFRPRQIRRIADAEADASIAAAEAEVQIRQILDVSNVSENGIGERTIRRMVSEEIKHQLNIEEITALAIEKLEPGSKPEEMETDFVSNLFNKCKNISDSEMQSLWASLLASEANNPGSFSKRTVALVDSLDRKDAELFSKFCSCCISFNSELTALSGPSVSTILEKNGVSFLELTHLDVLGLINFDHIGGFNQTLSFKTEPGRDSVCFSITHFGEVFIVRIENSPVTFQTGNALLTEAGKQLYQLAGAVSNLEYRDAIIQDLIGMGRWIYSTLPHPNHPSSAPK